jgi:hypothetical protein
MINLMTTTGTIWPPRIHSSAKRLWLIAGAIGNLRFAGMERYASGDFRARHCFFFAIFNVAWMIRNRFHCDDQGKIRGR